MRFSDLKKKFPSLRVGVLVIAAFALLGSMMIPSIGEKMGLNGSSCLAEYYQDECDTEYRNKLHNQMEYERCIAEVEKSARYWFTTGIPAICRNKCRDDGQCYDECVANYEAAFEKMMVLALEKCVDKWLK